MATGLTLIQTQTLTSTASSITFTNIPQNFKTLIVKYSARNSSADLPFNMQVNNGSGTQYSQYFHNDGGTKFAGRSTSGGSSAPYLYAAGTNQPAGVFSTCDVKFIDYAGSQTKQWFASYAILNSTSAYLVGRSAGYYTGVTTGITSITFSGLTFSIGTSFSLYGVGSPAMASGGTITYGGGYAYHTFTSTGSFLPSQQIKGAEILAVAGGASGGGVTGGGGGAGGVKALVSQTLNAGNLYTALVGAGGASITAVYSSGATNGNSGSSSVFGSISSSGGGGGGGYNSGTGSNGTAGGNGGGGGGGGSAGGTAGAAIDNFAGGNAAPVAGGGGGGAGAVGGVATAFNGGNGGNGTTAYTTWHSITGTGVLSGGIYYIAGGGSGGGDTNSGTAGLGGGGKGGAGGNAAGAAATANTGGGGGGAGGTGPVASGAGGSGLIIIRYPLS